MYDNLGKSTVKLDREKQ